MYLAEIWHRRTFMSKMNLKCIKWFYALLLFMDNRNITHSQKDGRDSDATKNSGVSAPAANNGERKLKDRYKFIEDADHIREHLKIEFGLDDKQAEDYMKKHDTQTQFFVMHDYDKNTKLDGLELFKSMSDHYEHHHHPDGEGHGYDGNSEKDETDSLTDFVDMILKDQDSNNDGYVDYYEYMEYYTKLGDV